VDDVYKACERFERLGVEFVKKPDDGKLICLLILLIINFLCCTGVAHDLDNEQLIQC
jgi:hypothetical protein